LDLLFGQLDRLAVVLPAVLQVGLEDWARQGLLVALVFLLPLSSQGPCKARLRQ
jgi:hypothetical protein